MRTINRIPTTGFKENVFKYYSNDTLHIKFFDIFLVRFTQPKRLNDALECTPEFVYCYDEDLIKKQAIKAAKRNKMVFKSQRDLDEFISKFAIDYKKTTKESFFKRLDEIGIFSLGKTPFNKHLWSHYAEGGYCIEFDSDSIFFQRTWLDPWGTGELRKVHYSDIPIKLDINKLLSDNRNGCLSLDVFYTKKNEWRDEDEVRIIRLRQFATESHRNGELSLFRVPSDSIKAIYFSKDAPNQYINKCLKKIQMRLPHITCYKVVDIEAKELFPIRNFL